MAGLTLEQRVAALEQTVAELQHGAAGVRPKRNWLSAVLGRFKGDADFAEVARAGQKMRATGRLPDEPPESKARP
jgi:hypothetical protein